MNVEDLKGIGFFGLLSDDELKIVLGIACARQFDKDQHVIRQSEYHSSLYLVGEGLLHVRRKSGRSDVFLGRIEKGGFFGEIGLFDPGPATATVRAMGRSTLYEIRRDDFQVLLEQQPALGCKILQAMMQEMARRLRRVDQRLVDSLFWGEGTPPVTTPGKA